MSVGSDGTWTFEAERKLGTGEHKFRADNIEEGTGIVVGSASIGIMRMEKPSRRRRKSLLRRPRQLHRRRSLRRKRQRPLRSLNCKVAAEEAKPAVTPEKRAERGPHRPRVYTVRRGDTLWEIAEAYYGGGWHYRAIVRDNRRKIHNPHWIYPRQKFHIPAGR